MVGGWSTTTIDQTLIVIDCWSQHVTFKCSLNLSCSIHIVYQLNMNMTKKNTMQKKKP